MKPRINLEYLQRLNLTPFSRILKGCKVAGITGVRERLSKTRSRVGLDIGSFYIKAVEVNETSRGLELVNFAVGEVQNEELKKE